jgi:pimeloyl-ACP methyl ester carboxylesterase
VNVAARDGRTLEVHEGGDPAGFPVLVHNGTPGSGLLYAPHVGDAEAKGIRLLSYDRPGYGGSTRQPGRTVADCAPDVEAICDALGLDRLGVWGISGGGPHALATAALLPERVVAAAALASVAPYDAEGLDWLAGMGEQNIEEFGAVAAGEEELRKALDRYSAELEHVGPDALVEVWSTLLGAADREVATGRLAAYLLDCISHAIDATRDGWFDDDRAFAQPWGFDPGEIRVPVQLRHGADDRFVPIAHGEWLAARIPGVDARLTREDGHLTLIQRHVPAVHAWLLERGRG